MSTSREFDHDLHHLKFLVQDIQLFQQSSKLNHFFQREWLNQNQREEDIHLDQKEYFLALNLDI